MAAKPRQLSFTTHPAFRQFRELSYGGETVYGRRRRMRPLDRRRAVHVVLRSSRARGGWSLARRENARKVERVLKVCVKRHGVTVMRHANVGNHLHLLLRFEERKGIQAFLRAFTGWLAREVTGARKGRPIGGRFWDSLAFTRVVEFGRALRNAYFYVLQNELEAEGVWDRRVEGRLASRFTDAGGAVLIRPG